MSSRPCEGSAVCTIDVLRGSLDDPALVREPPVAQARMRETLALMESLSVWSEAMLTLQTSALVKLMKLGARIAKFLHPDRRARGSDVRASSRAR